MSLGHSALTDSDSGSNGTCFSQLLASPPAKSSLGALILVPKQSWGVAFREALLSVRCVRLQRPVATSGDKVRLWEHQLRLWRSHPQSAPVSAAETRLNLFAGSSHHWRVRKHSAVGAFGCKAISVGTKGCSMTFARASGQCHSLAFLTQHCNRCTPIKCPVQAPLSTASRAIVSALRLRCLLS